MTQAAKNNRSILRISSVKAITGLSRSSIYALIKQDQFPKQVKLSLRSVGWVEEQVQAFLENKIAASQGPLAGGV